MIGYNPIGGYNLFNPITNKVLIGRDVVFNEVGSLDQKTKEQISENKSAYQMIVNLKEG